jgi:hypothetical protein
MLQSISSTARHFIFTCKEFSIRGESFFQPNSSPSIYFIFIFIKIIFLLFYLIFFSLSSFLVPLLNPLATLQPHPHPQLHHHAETKTQTTTPNPDRQPHNHTHGSTTTPRPKRKPPHPTQIGNPTRLHHHIQLNIFMTSSVKTTPNTAIIAEK